MRSSSTEYEAIRSNLTQRCDGNTTEQLLSQTLNRYPWRKKEMKGEKRHRLKCKIKMTLWGAKQRQTHFAKGKQKVPESGLINVSCLPIQRACFVRCSGDPKRTELTPLKWRGQPGESGISSLEVGGVQRLAAREYKVSEGATGRGVKGREGLGGGPAGWEL